MKDRSSKLSLLGVTLLQVIGRLCLLRFFYIFHYLDVVVTELARDVRLLLKCRSCEVLLFALVLERVPDFVVKGILALAPVCIVTGVVFSKVVGADRFHVLA